MEPEAPAPWVQVSEAGRSGRFGDLPPERAGAGSPSLRTSGSPGPLSPRNQLMLTHLQRDNVEAFKKMLICLKTEQPLALVGSGLVMRAGYPSWDNLMQKLHNYSGIARRVGTDRAEFIRKLDDPTYRADVYRKELQRANGRDDMYFKFLTNTFQPHGHKIDATLRRFARLGFSHFLTTNYDPTVQRAHGKIAADVIEWQADAARRDSFITTLGSGRPSRRSVVHLHGIWDRPDTIVLTDADYLERYVRREEARQLLFAIFATKSVVFVGFGLRDPDLMQLLRSVASSLSSRRGRHFVLLAHDPATEDAGLVRERLVQKFDINPVFYPETINHGLLEKLILALERRDPTLVPDFTKLIPEERRVPLVEAAAPFAERAPTQSVIDPDDPQKGRWGGNPVRNGRKLTARVKQSEENWFEVTVKVQALSGTPDLAGPVTFHLHDTFPEPDVGADRQNARRATLTRYAYGAFTVGADVHGEPTRLELNLAKLPKVPRAFSKA